MNKELLNYVFCNMPTNLTKTEKAIYLYIKLCKVLTYDELFYIMNASGEIAKYHENINNIKNISLNNNKIVCYEFNFIYAKLLDLLDIKYKIQDYSLNKYHKGHANLILESDGFSIVVDSVTSILMGDLANVKINYPIQGLICKNKPQEFQKLIKKIYIETIETKESIYKEYNLNETIFDRLKIIVDKVIKQNLQIIDSFSYLLSLRNILFDYDEKLSNFRVSIVKNNQTLKPLLILSLNEFDFETDEDETYYYTFDNYNLLETSIEELRSNFLNNTFEYFENDLSIIPNLNIKVLKK